MSSDENLGRTIGKIIDARSRREILRPGVVVTATFFLLAGVALPAYGLLAQTIHQEIGANGGHGGTSGGATGASALGGDGVGAPSVSGDGEIAAGGNGTGGNAEGGDAASGSAAGAVGEIADAISVNQTAAESTTDPDAPAVTAESIGGNGGDGGASGDATGGAGTGGSGIGGDAHAGDNGTADGGDGFGGDGAGGHATSGAASGGNGGDGGAVTIDNGADLVTSGSGSSGISAVSIGGDGGSGGTSGNATGGDGLGGDGVGGDAVAGDNGTATGGDGHGGDGFGGSAASGDASGGNGGDGGVITVDNQNAITTTGDDSHGISAITAGGNGGDGGTSGSAEGGTGTGGTGTGGTATAGVNGTAEDGSSYDGGGFAGEAMSGNADGGAGGDGGAISILNQADVTTHGVASHGVSAISSGGVGGAAGTSGTAATGGGIGGTASQGSSSAGADGLSGPISVESSGTITAHGTDSHGIFAATPDGNVDVLLSAGKVLGGTGGGAGVFLDGGASNVVTIRNGAFLGAFSGFAIHSSGASNAAENFGVVEGSVVMSGGANTFNNRLGALFRSGNIVDLAGGLLSNSGTLSPGGAGSLATTHLTGDFIQNAQGVYLVDADFHAMTSDLLQISGTAALDGSVQVNLLNLVHDNETVTVLTSAGGVTDDGISVIDTAVVDYSMSIGANSAEVTVEGIDFAPSGLAFNPASTARHLDSVFGAGGSALDPTLLLLANIVSLSDYAAALDRLHPEPYLTVTHGAMRAARRFSDAAVTGCRHQHLMTAAPRARCAWGGISGATFDQDRKMDRVGIEENAISLALGVEIPVDPFWTFGAALGYEAGWATVDNRADISTDRIMVGAVVKREEGPILLGLALTGGYGWTNVDRFIGLGTGTEASGETAGAFANARARAGYQLDFQPVSVTPRVDLDFTYVRMDGVHEQGAGPLNLKTGSTDERFFTLRPGIEFAHEFALAHGNARPYLFAGAVWAPNTTTSLTASFEGTPSGVAPFKVRTDSDRLLGELALGFDWLGAGNTRVHARYGVMAGGTTFAHGGTVQVGIPF